MLQKLVINNYAIIDHLSIEPDAQLNTVTGETGAGKSIILGALSLILGERADTSVLIKKDEKCVVEAFFNVKDNDTLQAAIAAEELDNEPVCIIRREISTSGKSRAFINDTPVTLNVLNRITSLLVDLHQQFDHLALEDDHFQLDVLDAVAQNGALLKEYKGLYTRYKKISQELEGKKQQQAQWQKEADYKQFLYDELQQAAFAADEIEQAEQHMKQQANAEKIISVLDAAYNAMEEGEQPLLNELKRLNQQIQGIADVMPETASLTERINSALAELKDVAAELDVLKSKVNIDQELMVRLQDRVDVGYKLLKKHGVQATADLLAIHRQLEAELQETLNLNDGIEKLAAEQSAIYKEVIATANKLSAQRGKVAPEIAKNVTELLALVGMPNAQFFIQLAPVHNPGNTGMDAVQFLLDANKSGKGQPIHKAASGGEMSRIMLCIKSLTAKAMHLPTLIFDEVDTGISGEAARQVGMLLRSLATYHQVICITHQPQVAAKGTCHFYVYKDATEGVRITTKVRILQPEERVLAIAKMIGGEEPSDAAMQNARELVTT
jgi:DNA repair protein RecN (Recombination protein N)